MVNALPAEAFSESGVNDECISCRLLVSGCRDLNGMPAYNQPAINLSPGNWYLVTGNRLVFLMLKRFSIPNV